MHLRAKRRHTAKQRGEFPISESISDAATEQRRRHQVAQGPSFVSEVFRNEEIGPEQMDEEVHPVFFCNTELGRVQQFRDEFPRRFALPISEAPGGDIVVSELSARLMNVPNLGIKHLSYVTFAASFFWVLTQVCSAQIISGLTPTCWVKGDPKDKCSDLSPLVRSEYASQCAHQQYGHLDEAWRSDERAYWSCRLGVPQKNLAEALEVANLEDEIANLTPFKIGETNFLMVDQIGGTADCRSFSIVAQSSADWRKVWELPDCPGQGRCGFFRSPQLQFDGRGFRLRLSQSYLKEMKPHVSPPETWAYRWTGHSFKLLQAPRSYISPQKDKRP